MERRREELPLSDLLIGMQCGGSDAFSGVTANPSAGYAADMLVGAGATVLFSEVTEVRDGVHLIAERCVSRNEMKQQWPDLIDSFMDFTDAGDEHRLNGASFNMVCM